jgi:hypothetical protein
MEVQFVSFMAHPIFTFDSFFPLRQDLHEKHQEFLTTNVDIMTYAYLIIHDLLNSKIECDVLDLKVIFDDVCMICICEII